MSLGLFLQSVLSFCTWLAWLNTALAWRILCNCAQLHHQLAFCSGTILFTLDPLAPHGQQLAFCRGAPYRWTASFTLWLFVAFCSGANFNFRDNFAQHGQQLAFCRGALFWWPDTFGLHWIWLQLWTPKSDAFCGGATPALTAFCGGALAWVQQWFLLYQIQLPSVAHGPLLAFCRGAFTQFSGFILFTTTFAQRFSSWILHLLANLALVLNTIYLWPFTFGLF